LSGGPDQPQSASTSIIPTRSYAPAFLPGLFQGFTAILTLIGSLFFRICIYAFPNGGFWYDAGFVTGFGASVLLLILFYIARIGGLVTREGS
jgi:hypothetical protein